MSAAPTDDAPSSVRSLRTLLPRPPVASKRVRPDAPPDVANPPPPATFSRRGAMLTRGKTVLKKAVSSGGAALRVRKSSSLQDGLRSHLTGAAALPPSLSPTASVAVRDGHSLTKLSSKADTDPDPDGLLPPNPQSRHRSTNSCPRSPPPPPNHHQPPPPVEMELEHPALAVSASRPFANGPAAHTDSYARPQPQRTDSGSHPQPAAANQHSALRHSFRKHSGISEASEPDDGGKAYEARFARVSRTGFVERSVAAAVISAARQRGMPRKSKSGPGSPRPPHHRSHGGFCNPWDSALKENGSRARGGSASRTFFHKVAKDRRPPDEQLATMLLLAARPDFEEGRLALSKDKYALASHWIGHSTFLLQARGLTVLTDPVWNARLGPLGPKRLVPPTCAISELPHTIDVVILSSACYDSFDKNAVQALASRVTSWLVPIGLRALLVSNNVKESAIIELDWWEEHRINDCLFVCTPAQHFSLRDDTLWCSWLVHAPHHRFFYCGATGYRSIYHNVEDSDSYEYRQKYGGASCPVFKEIHRRYGSCDTAFLPIGGFKPRTHMSGVQGDAIDMLFIHRDLHARRSVAHRWGTFASSEEGMLDAVRNLEIGLLSSPVAEHEFSYLRHGQLHLT